MDLTLLLLNNMPFHNKVMVLIRWCILIAVLGYILTMNPHYLFGGVITIIFLLAGSLYANLGGIMPPSSIMQVEGFQELALPGDNVTSDGAPIQVGVSADAGKTPLKQILADDYQPEDWHNPFGNMLLPEIKYNTDRKSAPPSFNLDTAENITRNVKRAIQKMNPGIQNTNKQLFGDLYNNFVLDNANRVFYSMPSTRVENDQAAFAQFLYHDLVYSGKESTPEGAMARVQDNYRYTLY